MKSYQPGILAPLPPVARHLLFSLKPEGQPQESLKKLRAIADGEKLVVGIGKSLTDTLDKNIEGLKNFVNDPKARVNTPSTPFALWCWLRGTDRGELVHQTHLIRETLEPSFEIKQTIDSFQYGTGLDLTGYEDGTENPKGEKAIQTAFVENGISGMSGSSFVAVQQWVHDLTKFQSQPQTDQDNTIGRRKSDNKELEDAPPTAHIKRTDQESFSPEAFMLRRSMPWSDATQEGLVFVAFGKSFEAFDLQMKRMVGAEDGIIDALFNFTKPITSSYFWCPPIIQGQLDLTALGF